jgi:hypothetical protein
MLDYLLNLKYSVVALDRVDYVIQDECGLKPSVVGKFCYVPHPSGDETMYTAE